MASKKSMKRNCGAASKERLACKWVSAEQY
jgi:hypothetical protein